MNKQQLTTAIILLVVDVAIFFAGRLTAPATDQDQDLRSQYDSLVKVQRITDERAHQAELREAYFKAEGERSYREGFLAAEQKPKSRKRYEQDTAANHRLDPDQRDSILWARYQKRMPTSGATSGLDAHRDR